MIFVTVGTQLPFDRLIAAVDDWAAAQGRSDVIAQVGRSMYQPRTIRTVASFSPAEFQKTFAAASLIVSHAGLGTILSALELGKPIVVMPRRAAMAEHRNDHQLATAKRFANRRGVAVVHHEKQIAAQLDAMEALGVGQRIDSSASPVLIEAIRDFIAGGQPVGRARAAVPVR